MPDTREADVEQAAFQARVHPWLLECFGAEIAADKAERNHRFLEESLELVQSIGCTSAEAHQLVDYVYGRPSGDSSQEIGGVMVTLAALCLANGFDMHAAGETELARIWTKIDTIRAKQAGKPKRSPLPAAPALPREPLELPNKAGLWTLEEGKWELLVTANLVYAGFMGPGVGRYRMTGNVNDNSLPRGHWITAQAHAGLREIAAGLKCFSCGVAYSEASAAESCHMAHREHWGHEWVSQRVLDLTKKLHEANEQLAAAVADKERAERLRDIFASFVQKVAKDDRASPGLRAAALELDAVHGELASEAPTTKGTP